MRPTRQQVESAVIRAIQLARNGDSVEDDAVELKREWPEPKKARQLAGSANRLNGEPLIYVVGVDEQGKCFPTGATEPSDWWAQIENQFDEVAPDLAIHMNVSLESGDSVVAMAFLTDRAPYVIKNPLGGAPECEVPIRTATGTRSANRATLIRMLSNVASRPTLTLLAAEMTLEDDPTKAATSVAVTADIFVETSTTNPVLLPKHDIVGRLDMNFYRESETVSLDYYGRPLTAADFRRASTGEREIHEAIGVRVRKDGILITGPGAVTLSFRGLADQRSLENWSTRDVQLTATLSFGVANHSLPVNVRAELGRSPIATVWRAERTSRVAER